MRLWAIMIGREPKYDPYIAYKNEPGNNLAIFESRRIAETYKLNEGIKNGYIVKFELVKP